MKNKMCELIIDNETFKKLKKYKKVIYLQSDDNNISELKDKSKVTVINKDTNKTLAREIKKVYKYNNYKDLKDSLNKKIKYISPKNYEEVYSNDENIVVVEFKYKKML